MKSKFLKRISIESEEDFTLLGIICSKPIYKLAFLMNQNLNFDFKILNNDHLEYTIPNLCTIYFYHYLVDWYLLENIFPKKNKKFKDFDFFLIRSPQMEEIEIQAFMQKIQAIDEVTASAILEHRKEIVELFSNIL